MKYEYGLSLAETGTQLAVTNNDFSLIYGIRDVVFVVFAEQRPEVLIYQLVKYGYEELRTFI